MHRFVWDLRRPKPAVLSFGYPIAAIYRNTPVEPRGPWVAPGQYTVRLTVAGRATTQPLTVRLDPRVKTPPDALAQQDALSLQLYDALLRDDDALQRVRSVRTALRERSAGATGELAAAIRTLDGTAATLEGTGGGFGGGAGGPDTFVRLNGHLASLLETLQDADVAPTSQAVAAVAERQRALDGLLARWREIVTTDLPALNERLRAAGLPAIPVE
jgi:hypothetical protein